MKTNNPNSLIVTQADNCATNQSRQALFGVLLLNRWVRNNRCANQAWKKLASVLPLSLVLMHVQMPKAQAAPLIQCSNVSFEPQVIYTVGSYPISVTVGDFNSDGKQDLATANSGSDNVSVLFNNGNGTFLSPVNYPVRSNPFSVTVGDVNGDGNQDLVTANSSSETVLVLLNNGNGTFLSPVNYPVGSNPFSVTVGDVNGDGNQDLVTANFRSDNLSVLLNNGNGTFLSPVNYPVGSNPLSVTVSDVNGDGNQDLATVSYGSDNVSVLLNNGNGTFLSPVNYPVGSSPFSLTVGDVNGDGNQDLVTANYSSDNLSVLLNNGNGTFLSPVKYPVGSNPFSATAVTVGDVNGDGKQDLATTNSGSNTVSVLLNNCTPAAPPDKTPPSAEVTYTPSDLSKQVQIATKDINSGLSSIVVSSSNNATVTIPNFQPGTKNPVVVTAKQIDPSKGLSFQVRVTDIEGNVSTSDLATLMIGATGKPVALNLTKVIQQESIVQILNSTPGLTNLRLSVNGTNFQASGLVGNEVRVIDISSALKLNNTMTFKALGKPNGRALIWIREPSTP